MQRFLIYLFGLAMLAGCAEEKKAPETPSVTVPKEPENRETDAQRLERFRNRRVASTPRSLPAAWARLLKNLDAKLIEAEVQGTTHQTDWRGGRRLKLHFRLFGRDSEVDARLYQALSKLKLSDLKDPLSSQRMDGKTKGWSLEIDRVVAPRGAARQTDVQLSWYRRPQPPKQRGKCRKPHPVEADRALPSWLRRVSSKMSTRRRILAFVKTSTERVTGRIHMLYHNGFAHDENVGQMVTAARKAGLRPAGGDGPNQTLTGPAGERLQLSTIREPHDMGCTLKGPILEVQWHSTVIVHKDKL